jgi:hypothetical protein
MAQEELLMRRVVVGNNPQNLSCVLFDSDAPNVRPDPARPGGGMVEHWCWGDPIELSKTDDLGLPPFNNSPPQFGGFLRYVRSLKMPEGYIPEEDAKAVRRHEELLNEETGHSDRGGKHAGMSAMHKTRTIDYGFLVQGERSLVLDDDELPMYPGDFCVQLGNYHAWANRTHNSIMGYVMIGADFTK